MEPLIVLREGAASVVGLVMSFVLAAWLLAFILGESAAILLGVGLALRALLGHAGPGRR